VRGWLVWGAFCAALLDAASAPACIAPPRSYTLRDAWPAPDASNVPLNTPLSFHLERLPNYDDYTGEIFSTIMPLRDEQTGELVPVRTVDLGLPDTGVFSFVPLTPLAPRTAYSVDMGTPPPQAGQAGEPSQTRWRFTTGSANAAELHLQGDIGVSYEAGTEPVYDCGPGLCGPGCDPSGTRDVTRARVTLPAPFDGFAAQGLEGRLEVREQLAPAAPPGVSLTAYSEPAAEQTSELLVMMPERADGSAYVPCFDYTVRDAAGQAVTSTLCLSEEYPLPGTLGEDATPRDPPPHRPRTSTACTFAPATGHGAASAFTMLVLLLLSQRRRSKTAL
jgi:hypothetical protein